MGLYAAKPRLPDLESRLFIVKPTIKFTLSDVARLGNLASNAVNGMDCPWKCQSIFRFYYKLPLMERSQIKPVQCDGFALRFATPLASAGNTVSEMSRE